MGPYAQAKPSEVDILPPGPGMGPTVGDREDCLIWTPELYRPSIDYAALNDSGVSHL
jgi:hypothetical protein